MFNININRDLEGAKQATKGGQKIWPMSGFTITKLEHYRLFVWNPIQGLSHHWMVTHPNKNKTELHVRHDTINNSLNVTYELKDWRKVFYLNNTKGGSQHSLALYFSMWGCGQIQLHPKTLGVFYNIRFQHDRFLSVTHRSWLLSEAFRQSGRWGASSPSSRPRTGPCTRRRCRHQSLKSKFVFLKGESLQPRGDVFLPRTLSLLGSSQ